MNSCRNIFAQMLILFVILSLSNIVETSSKDKQLIRQKDNVEVDTKQLQQGQTWTISATTGCLETSPPYTPYTLTADNIYQIKSVEFFLSGMQADQFFPNLT